MFPYFLRLVTLLIYKVLKLESDGSRADGGLVTLLIYKVLKQTMLTIIWNQA